VGVTEAELWRMSWLALDARCRAADRANWQQWEHTRLLVAAWTGQRPAQVLALPTDRPPNGAKTTTPDPEWMEKMRQRALQQN